jgi:isopentenyldiphosphate isomerase
MSELYPKDLIRDLSYNNVIPFIGSGISKPSGLPLWEELILEFLEESGEDILTSDIKDLYGRGLISISDAPELVNIIRKNRFPLLRFMKERIGKPVHPNEYHCTLSRLSFDTILTTNFDTLVEHQYELEGMVLNRIWANKHLSFFDEKRATQLIKIHGTIDDIDSIVVAVDDYQDYVRTRRLIYHVVSSLFLTKTVIFLGFSLRDPNITDLLSKIKSEVGDTVRTHYAVLYEPDRETVLRSREFGVKVISLAGGDIFQSTLAWLEELRRRASLIGVSNLDKALMVNEGIREELAGYVPGSVLRMRANLGILSNPRSNVLGEPIYGAAKQDEAELTMGNLARLFLEKSPRNRIKCIVHINPRLSLDKGYKSIHVMQRLKAMQEFLDSFGEQIDLAHAPHPIDLNHVIVGERASFITLQRAREIGYQRVQRNNNRWVIRSEITNFDNDFEALRAYNEELAESVGLDLSNPHWPRELSGFLLKCALDFLDKRNGVVVRVDEGGGVPKVYDRLAAHSDGTLHYSVHLHIIDVVRRRVLLQRRARSKDLLASMLNVSVSGHPETHDFLSEILREAAEELGIWIDPEKVRYVFDFDRAVGSDHELVKVFIYGVDDHSAAVGANFSDLEAQSICWVDFESLDKMETFEADGFLCYGCMRLSARFKLYRADFSPGVLEEINRVVQHL